MSERPSDEPAEGRRSRCDRRHVQTEERADGTYGQNWNGRQWLWGAVPIDAPSSHGLPFFNPRPDEAFDSHYCGCMGWS